MSAQPSEGVTRATSSLAHIVRGFHSPELSVLLAPIPKAKVIDLSVG